MIEVVMMAARVPIGIDFWASRRSPDRFDPAMIPAREREREGEIGTWSILPDPNHTSD